MEIQLKELDGRCIFLSKLSGKVLLKRIPRGKFYPKRILSIKEFYDQLAILFDQNLRFNLHFAKFGMGEDANYYLHFNTFARKHDKHELPCDEIKNHKDNDELLR